VDRVDLTPNHRVSYVYAIRDQMSQLIAMVC
jgi:hypothetical protein